MKLSELFKTPFKVKGGGVLNLRGFSKRIVDKEIEGGGNNVRFPVSEKILNLFFNKDLIAHPSKFVKTIGTEDVIVDIDEIDTLPTEIQQFYFLYKKSDIDAILTSKTIIYSFTIGAERFDYSIDQIQALTQKIYTIDNIPYCILYYYSPK